MYINKIQIKNELWGYMKIYTWYHLIGYVFSIIMKKYQESV